MAKKQHESPMLDKLEDGPWPSFVTGLKRLATDGDKPSAKMMTDLIGQLEHSYETRTGYWKGGTVSVFGYGGGIIPREDIPRLKEAGIKEVFLPGTPLSEIIGWTKRNLNLMST